MLLGVASLLEDIDLGLQKPTIVNAPIQALTTENADFDLCHVQPACIFWGVPKLHAAQDFGGPALAQYVVEAFSNMRVEVIQNQKNLVMGGTDGEQAFKR